MTARGNFAGPEAGYLPVSEYIGARRAWIEAELAATERRLQSLVLSPFDRWECEEYARDLQAELNGEKVCELSF
jgi:hypothetical protein